MPLPLCAQDERQPLMMARRGSTVSCTLPALCLSGAASLARADSAFARHAGMEPAESQGEALPPSLYRISRKSLPALLHSTMVFQIDIHGQLRATWRLRTPLCPLRRLVQPCQVQGPCQVSLAERFVGAPGTSGSEDREEWERAWAALLWTFAAAAAYTLASAYTPAIKSFPLFTWLGLPGVTAWGWEVAPSMGYVGQGMIMGPKTALSMLGGALLGARLVRLLSVMVCLRRLTMRPVHCLGDIHRFRHAARGVS